MAGSDRAFAAQLPLTALLAGPLAVAPNGESRCFIQDERIEMAQQERTLVRGGTVVTEAWTGVADVLVEGETIVAVGRDLATRVSGDYTDVDATGRYVLPGGIDVHTHMEMPQMGYESADDFFTGTRAAALGGTTTIVDFAVQPELGTLLEGLREWQEKAQGKAVVDYGFHMIVRRGDDETLSSIPKLIEEGVNSFKVFMAYPHWFYLDDGQITQVMEAVVAASDSAVVMVHAENGPVIDVRVAESLAAGLNEPIDHARTRPVILEAEAAGRAVVMAGLTGAPLHVVHVSSALAAGKIAEAVAVGQDVSGETCPQYLYLTEERLALGGVEGAKYICTPPLRTSAEVEALWGSVIRGELGLVATDHCPFCLADKARGMEEGFHRVPQGVAGVEHRVVLLYQAVRDGRIGLGDWVRLIAGGPARRFGLEPRKGSLTPGADADIVIFDPDAQWTLSMESQATATDYCIYEGIPVIGRVETVLRRGDVIVEDAGFTGTAGTGQFIRRPVNS
jgi:dihydropyrimidinase